MLQDRPTAARWISLIFQVSCTRFSTPNYGQTSVPAHMQRASGRTPHARCGALGGAPPAPGPSRAAAHLAQQLAMQRQRLRSGAAGGLPPRAALAGRARLGRPPDLSPPACHAPPGPWHGMYGDSPMTCKVCLALVQSVAGRHGLPVAQAGPPPSQPQWHAGAWRLTEHAVSHRHG